MPNFKFYLTGKCSWNLYCSKLQAAGFCSCNIREKVPADGGTPNNKATITSSINKYKMKLHRLHACEKNHMQNEKMFHTAAAMQSFQSNECLSIYLACMSLLWVICLMCYGWLSFVDNLWSANVMGGLRQKSYCAALNHQPFNCTCMLYHAHSHSTLFLSMHSSRPYFLSALSVFHCRPFSPFFHYLYHSALGLPPPLICYFRWLHLSLSHSLLLLTSRYLEVSLEDT